MKKLVIDKIALTALTNSPGTQRHINATEQSVLPKQLNREPILVPTTISDEL